MQRRMIEILVESIEARTVEPCGVPSSEIVILLPLQPAAGTVVVERESEGPSCACYDTLPQVAALRE